MSATPAHSPHRTGKPAAPAPRRRKSTDLDDARAPAASRAHVLARMVAVGYTQPASHPRGRSLRDRFNALVLEHLGGVTSTPRSTGAAKAKPRRKQRPSALDEVVRDELLTQLEELVVDTVSWLVANTGSDWDKARVAGEMEFEDEDGSPTSATMRYDVFWGSPWWATELACARITLAHPTKAVDLGLRRLIGEQVEVPPSLEPVLEELRWCHTPPGIDDSIFGCAFVPRDFRSLEASRLQRLARSLRNLGGSRLWVPKIIWAQSPDHPGKLVQCGHDSLWWQRWHALKEAAWVLHFAGHLVEALIPDVTGYCCLCYRRLPATATEARTTLAAGSRRQAVPRPAARQYCEQHAPKIAGAGRAAESRGAAAAQPAGDGLSLAQKLSYNSEHRRAARNLPTFRASFERLLEQRFASAYRAVEALAATREINRSQIEALASAVGKPLGEELLKSFDERGSNALGGKPRDFFGAFFLKWDAGNPLAIGQHQAPANQPNRPIDSLALTHDLLRLSAWLANEPPALRRRGVPVDDALEQQVLTAVRRGATSTRAIARELRGQLSPPTIGKILRKHGLARRAPRAGPTPRVPT